MTWLQYEWIFKIWENSFSQKYNIFYGFLFSNWCNSKSFLFCIKSYDALGHATIRTQWRGTESVHSDSFSYKAETNSPELPWTPPLQYSYDNIGNRKTNAGDREKFINAYSILYIFTKLLWIKIYCNNISPSGIRRNFRNLKIILCQNI